MNYTKTLDNICEIVDLDERQIGEDLEITDDFISFTLFDDAKYQSEERSSYVCISTDEWKIMVDEYNESEGDE